MQRLWRAADLLRDGKPSPTIATEVTLMIRHHPHRPLAGFRRKLVRRLADTGSTISGVGASDGFGAVQLALSGPFDGCRNAGISGSQAGVLTTRTERAESGQMV